MSELSLPTLSRAQLPSFCDRWGIVELAIRGSAVHGELRPDSDLDVLVSFHPDRSVSLLDLAELEPELGEIWGREVELVTRQSVGASENSIRRKEILESAQKLFGGWIFSRDTAGDVHERGPNEYRRLSSTSAEPVLHKIREVAALGA